MNIKGNTTVEGEVLVEQLPITSTSLSAVVEVSGKLSKRQLGDIATLPKETYIPGLSVSFPPIFNLNTESLDYNNRSLVASLKNQMQGTSFMAPTNSNGTPAFRRIVKSDLSDAGVVFSDDSRINNWNTAYGWGDFRDYGLGTNSSNRISNSNLSSIKNTSIVSFDDGFDEPYPYGSVITMYKDNDEFTQLTIPVVSNVDHNHLAYRGKLTNGTVLPWVKVWDEFNLTKLSQLTNDSNFSTQTWVTSQNYSKQTLVAGSNVTISGSTISATNTTYDSGTAQLLTVGTDVSNRVWSAKILTDYIKANGGNKQIFEFTLGGGIKVKDWISQAGTSSIAIGQNSNAIMSNSLALLTGSLAEGNRAISVGFLSQAFENDSIAIGSYVTSRETSFSLGHSIANNQKYCTVVGAFNIDVSKNNPQQILYDDHETPVFVIGSGTSDVVRGNAQITYRDGSTRNFGRQYYDSNVRSVMDFTDPNTLVDVQYISENGSGLTPNPNGLTGSQYSGDVIANPIWLGNIEPDNLSLVYIHLETINGTVWTKFVGTHAPTSITAVVGVYLKSHKKILIRGYFVNNLLTTLIHEPWVYNLTNNTANFSSILPASYRILGNVVNTRNKVIYFNPR